MQRLFAEAISTVATYRTVHRPDGIPRHPNKATTRKEAARVEIIIKLSQWMFLLLEFHQFCIQLYIGLLDISMVDLVIDTRLVQVAEFPGWRFALLIE